MEYIIRSDYMPVITGRMANLSETITEDYPTLVAPGMVTIAGVISKAGMSNEQLEHSIVEWLATYKDEDPSFFINSIYVILQYMHGGISYIPIEIFKKYATEY